MILKNPSSTRLLLAALLVFSVTACGMFDSDPTYSDKAHDDMYKNGSLTSDEGGFSFFGGEKKPEGPGIGVNGFLWRATLDTINFMPIQSADPFGGVIITDWYSPPQTPDQRTKLNIFIRDRDLRADGVRVTVFRQDRTDTASPWTDASVSPTTAIEMENAILTKARQIRLAQKQFQ